MLTLISLALFGADVRRLDDDSFDVRQLAEARLTAHAWLAWRACDLPMNSPEQRRRAGRVCRYHLDFGVTPTILAPAVWGWWTEPDGEQWIVVGAWPGQPLPAERITYVPAAPLRAATNWVAQALVREGVPPVIVRAWLAYFTQLEAGRL